MEHGRVFVSELSFPKPEQTNMGMGMMRSMGPEIQLTEVDTKLLVENFAATLSTLNAMLTAVPDQPNSLNVDEVEVSLSIAGDGKVAFVGGGGYPGIRGGGSSITLTLRRRKH